MYSRGISHAQAIPAMCVAIAAPEPCQLALCGVGIATPLDLLQAARVLWASHVGTPAATWETKQRPGGSNKSFGRD